MQPQAEVYPVSGSLGNRNRACKVHGNLNKQVELRITSGSVAPTVGETLTGATSGDTGVVVLVQLESGSWAGGDAVAAVVINNHTGVDADTGEWGSTTETINGSTGGTNMMTRFVAPEQSIGIIFPESSMVFHENAWYCIDCYRRKFVKKYLDEWVVTDDDDYLRTDRYGR
jgi:hypothetical protein